MFQRGLLASCVAHRSGVDVADGVTCQPFPLFPLTVESNLRYSSFVYRKEAYGQETRRPPAKRDGE